VRDGSVLDRSDRITRKGLVARGAHTAVTVEDVVVPDVHDDPPPSRLDVLCLQLLVKLPDGQFR